MYYKITSLIIISLFIIQIVGCDTEDVISNPNDGILTKLDGNIANWSEGTNKMLRLGKPGYNSFLEFGKSSIGASGNFNLSTIIPSESIISPIIDWFRINTIMNLQIDNPETKGFESYLNIFSVDGTIPIGEVKYSNDSQNNGKDYFSVSYFYSEGVINIVGSKTAEYNSDNFKGILVTNYNIHFKKGWNRLVYKVLEETKAGDITTFYNDEWTNEVPSEGKWYYRIYN